MTREGQMFALGKTILAIMFQTEKKGGLVNKIERLCMKMIMDNPK